MQTMLGFRGSASMAGRSCCRPASWMVAAQARALRLQHKRLSGKGSGKRLVKVDYNVNDLQELVAAMQSSQDPTELCNTADQIAALVQQPPQQQQPPPQQPPPWQPVSQQVLNLQVEVLEAKLSAVAAGVSDVKAGLIRLEQKVDQNSEKLEKKVDQNSEKLEKLEKKFDVVNQNLYLLAGLLLTISGPVQEAPRNILPVLSKFVPPS